MNIFIVVHCAVVGYIRPKSALVICCGLLAKWLRVMAGARECTSCIFFCLFLWSYKCGEHLRLCWFGGLHKFTCGFMSCG